MNVTEMDNSTTATPPAVTEGVTKALTTLSTDTNTTVTQVITTAIPSSADGAIITVVIVVILLTVAVLGFLLYRYLCHNKGDYRTTGELAPGEDFEEELHSKPAKEKKEYFI